MNKLKASLAEMNEKLAELRQTSTELGTPHLMEQDISPLVKCLRVERFIKEAGFLRNPKIKISPPFQEWISIFLLFCEEIKANRKDPKRLFELGNELAIELERLDIVQEGKPVRLSVCKEFLTSRKRNPAGNEHRRRPDLLTEQKELEIAQKMDFTEIQVLLAICIALGKLHESVATRHDEKPAPKQFLSTSSQPTASDHP